MIAIFMIYVILNVIKCLIIIIIIIIIITHDQSSYMYYLGMTYKTIEI